jgi:hypothetical protein
MNMNLNMDKWETWLVIVAGIAVLGLFIILIAGEIITAPGAAAAQTGAGLGTGVAGFFSNLWGGIKGIFTGSGNSNSNGEGQN